MLRIFVSHSSNDNDWCIRFVSTLESKGYDVWFDKTGLYAGSQWVSMIEQEIQSREIFLLVLTPDAWNSEWVQNEARLAMIHNKHIIPVLHKRTNASGFIQNYQWLNVMGLDSVAAANIVIDAIEPSSSLNRSFTGYLVLTRSGSTNLAQGTRWDIRLPVSLGSSSDNSIVLRSGLVSPYHARISLKNGELWVEDLNSSRGTSIDGNQVLPNRSRPLRSGQTLILGDVWLSFMR